MSRSIYECLRDLHESGYTLSQLVGQIEMQLANSRNSPSTSHRYLSIARTHIETASLYLQQYERETDSPVPLLFEGVGEVEEINMSLASE